MKTHARNVHNILLQALEYGSVDIEYSLIKSLFVEHCKSHPGYNLSIYLLILYVQNREYVYIDFFAKSNILDVKTLEMLNTYPSPNSEAIPITIKRSDIIERFTPSWMHIYNNSIIKLLLPKSIKNNILKTANSYLAAALNQMNNIDLIKLILSLSSRDNVTVTFIDIPFDKKDVIEYRKILITTLNTYVQNAKNVYLN